MSNLTKVRIGFVKLFVIFFTKVGNGSCLLSENTHLPSPTNIRSRHSVSHHRPFVLLLPHNLRDLPNRNFPPRKSHPFVLFVANTPRFHSTSTQFSLSLRPLSSWNSVSRSVADLFYMCCTDWTVVGICSLLASQMVIYTERTWST